MKDIPLAKITASFSSYFPVCQININKHGNYNYNDEKKVNKIDGYQPNNERAINTMCCLFHD